MNTRTIKVEEDGHQLKRKLKPKIRLRGYWLARAGFRPGSHVSVKLIAQGLIELRSHESTLLLYESFQQIDLPEMDE